MCVYIVYICIYVCMYTYTCKYDYTHSVLLFRDKDRLLLRRLLGDTGFKLYELRPMSYFKNDWRKFGCFVVTISFIFSGKKSIQDLPKTGLILTDSRGFYCRSWSGEISLFQLTVWRLSSKGTDRRGD